MCIREELQKQLNHIGLLNNALVEILTKFVSRSGTDCVLPFILMPQQNLLFSFDNDNTVVSVHPFGK